MLARINASAFNALRCQARRPITLQGSTRLQSSTGGDDAADAWTWKPPTTKKEKSGKTRARRAPTTEPLDAKTVATLLEAEGAVDVTTLRPRNVDLCDAMVLASARSQRHLRALADALLVEAKRRPGPRPRAEGHQRGAGDDWVCVDLDRGVVQLLSEEARERLGLEDLHTGSWDPQLDDIEDVPWRNYVEGEPLPPDR